MPSVETVPEAADHETAVLKLPVPVTLAAHWLICPLFRVVGLHETVTDVIVEPCCCVESELKDPPAHPANHTMPKSKRLTSALRTIYIRPFIKAETSAGIKQGFPLSDCAFPDAVPEIPRRSLQICNESKF